MGGIPDTRVEISSLERISGVHQAPDVEVSNTIESETGVDKKAISISSQYGFWRTYGFTVLGITLLWFGFALLIGGLFFASFTTLILIGVLLRSTRLASGEERDKGKTGSIFERLGECFKSSQCPDCGMSIFGSPNITWYQRRPDYRYIAPRKVCDDCGHDFTKVRNDRP